MNNNENKFDPAKKEAFVEFLRRGFDTIGEPKKKVPVQEKTSEPANELDELKLKFEAFKDAPLVSAEALFEEYGTNIFGAVNDVNNNEKALGTMVICLMMALEGTKDLKPFGQAEADFYISLIDALGEIVKPLSLIAARYKKGLEHVERKLKEMGIKEKFGSNS